HAVQVRRCRGAGCGGGDARPGARAGTRPRPTRGLLIIGQSVHVMRVSRLQSEDVALVGALDRSEHVDVEYRVVDGELRPAPPATPDIPPWDPTGSGPHSVAAHVEFCRSVVARGGVLLGARDDERTVGLAIVHPLFEPPLAWLAFLHVSRPFR